MSSLVVVSNYYYGCKGGCKGCQLSSQERRFNSPNIHLSNLTSSLHQIISNSSNLDFFSLVLGKGNMLELDDIEHIVSTSQRLLLENKPSGKSIIEINTSLIGDVDKQKKKALSIVKNALSIELKYNIQTRFIIVYDLTNPSPQYKEQVKSFLEELSALRKKAGIKEHFDTIQIILPINNLRSPADVINFFSFHRGAFNVGWGKFSKLSSSRLLKAQDWLLEFSKISQGKIDLNINNNLNNLNLINDKDVLSQAINNMKRVLFIQDDGQIELGDFTAFGEFDTRALLGLNHNPLLASSIFKQEWKAFSKQKNCLSCSYQKECMFLGGHKIALFNKAHNPNVSQIDCPSLLKPLIERVCTGSC